MSSYVYELQRGEFPEQLKCPFHREEKFRKHGKFWKCPQYHECGCTIGSRRLVGHVTKMWIRQTKKGKAWAKAIQDAAAERWWDQWPKLFAAACYCAAVWKP
jgi:hypothetical protein